MRMLPREVRQHVDLGGVVDELASADAWDAIRTRGPGPFRFPESPDDYERHVEEVPVIAQRAAALAAALEPRVASYGVGVGVLEWHLARSGIDLVVTEHSPATVARLREVAGLEAVEHDLVRDPPVPATTHLMHRVDTELSGREWRRILPRYDRVVFVPGALTEDAAELRAARRRRGAFAGWLRNEAAVKRLWARSHTAREIAVHDLRGWVLTPRERGRWRRGRSSPR